MLPFLQPTRPSARTGQPWPLLHCLATALLLCAGSLASAQAYPDKPVKLIVPFAPGGSNDVIARALGNALQQRLGQPVIIENKGGAGGVLGTDFVAKQPPNGYTLLLISSSLTTNAAIKKSLPYDPVKDLEPIALIGAGAFVVVVGNNVPIKTFTEFLTYAKAHPKAINYGSAGIGGINHLGTEMLASAAHIELTHIPYKGIGPAFADLMGGQLQMALPSVPSVASQLKSNTMRGLAVTGAKRSSLVPDLPTVAESGVPGFRLEVWWGVMAPAGLPKPVLAKLNETVNDILRSPEMREALAKEGAEPMPGTPAEFGDLIKTEITRWSQVIRDAKIPQE